MCTLLYALSFIRDGGGISDLFRCAAPKLHQCAGSHGAGAANLCLASSARPRDGRPVCDDLADACAGVKCFQYPAFRTVKAVIAGDQNRGRHTAGYGGGSRYDTLHTGIGILPFSELRR